MSFPYSPRMHEAKLESLHTQHEFLNLLRLRHLQWKSMTGDPEVERAHQEVADLIDEITDRYRHLLEVAEPERVPA